MLEGKLFVPWAGYDVVAVGACFNMPGRAHPTLHKLPATAADGRWSECKQACKGRGCGERCSGDQHGGSSGE